MALTRRFDMYLHRTICSVLEEMRSCNETKNYSYLLGLIEEAQSMGNKMESKIDLINDFEELKDKYKELEEQKNELKKEIKSKGGKIAVPYVENWE